VADCPFRDGSQYGRFVKATPEWAAVRQALVRRDDAGARRGAKELLKTFHVDKFRARYRACDPDVALDVTRELSGYVVSRKRRKGDQGFDESWDNMKN
jgi:hypothetical protein